VLWGKKKRPSAPPELLIVGLGNPGPEYSGTRHNVGFETIERLSAKHGIKIKKVKHRALTGEGEIEGVSVVLAKPLTFMNLSGNAIAPLARKYGIQPDQILVIADDLDLPVGTVRLRAKGSPGGHNGHKSIQESLRTDAYPRVKIGIASPGRAEAVEHVLSKFRPDEREKIQESIDKAIAAIESILKDGVASAMNWVNVRGKGEPEDQST
jgi:PTH1 family peptidyl-tRNA hydrolase